MSVGEVRRPPTIASVPVLCMDAGWLITLVVPLCHWSLAFGGRHQTSIAYRIMGIVMGLFLKLVWLAHHPFCSFPDCGLRLVSCQLSLHASSSDEWNR